MIEVRQYLWEVPANIRCVTTNGTVMSNGHNVMGGGCAREAAHLYPDAPKRLGDLISAHGNHVYLIDVDLIAFPTKEDVKNPSTVERVKQSLRELLTLAGIYGWTRIALPRPGCGLGGLSWDTDVRPLCERLDDRFILVDYPSPA